jgi:hypothetical protein
MEELLSIYKSMVRDPEGKRVLERFIHKGDNYFQIGCGVDSTGSG